MSRRAWGYIAGILILATVLIGWTTVHPDSLHGDLSILAVLIALATVAQLSKAMTPHRAEQSYSAVVAFFFAGVLLLHPLQFAFLVAIVHAIEWLGERLKRTGNLRDWYIQPFNVATHIIAGAAARWTYGLLAGDPAIFLSPSALLAAGTAALAYVAINHYVIGQALALARNTSWRASGVFDFDNVLTDFVMVSLGYVVAVLWQVSAWLLVPALSPFVLVYRALQIPQLKVEAASDTKTGLWNARHFGDLLSRELERARRFDRPLTVIMADLDLLRTVNNRHGHLAGDAVLAGVGRIIRAAVREYDIAGRFGGEEFALALPETGAAAAAVMAERIRSEVESAAFEVESSPTPIRVTVSMGIAAFPADASTANDLIHQADVALYQAKLRGRNCVMAASDVPHFVRLESLGVQDGPPERAGIERDGGETQAQAATPAAPPTPPVSNRIGDSPKVLRKRSSVMLQVFVSLVVAAGMLLALWSWLTEPLPNLAALFLLVAIAAMVELFQIDLYGTGTISVSVAVNFAAALITGLSGAAVVSAAIAVSGVIASSRRLRRPIRVYKVAFNCSAHILAALAPVLSFRLFGLIVQPGELLSLALPVTAAALAYYVIETGLIAGAIAMESATSTVAQWRERFRWLAQHYLVLCILGVFLSIAYTALGTLGVAVFAVPVVMMRFAQKQYIERTRDSVIELKRLNEELTLANREIILASDAIHLLNADLFVTLGRIVDARDPYVSGHSAKVAEYATAIAREMRLPAERVEIVRQAGYLHDIGKIAISERILQKPTRLTPEEYEYMKTHAPLGADLLESSRGLRHLAPFIRYHHERWDGRGYPEGLRAEEIPLEARILGVCDAVEAMASDRPYHRGMGLDEIIDEIKRCSGTQFEPSVVEVLVRIIEREGSRLITNSAVEVARRQGDQVPFEPKPSPALALQRLN